MAVFVGTSGWQYRDWRGAFYPAELPQRAWLEHYVARFRTVEVNNTFYRLPQAETFADWSRRTPDDFVMVLKLSRYLTHIKRLRDPEEPVARFLERAGRLGAKRGPLLLQLPPRMVAEPARLADTLDRFPPGTPIAAEFRDPSWFSDEVADILSRRGAALCLADRKGEVLGPLWRTAGWGYVRLHEGTASPRPCYDDQTLGRWAERIAGCWGPDDDVYVFFNNDPRCCAVSDARRFARHLEQVGLVPTRVPGEDEVRVVQPAPENEGSPSPADGAAADGAPADGAPADGAPADGAPADGAPAGRTSVTSRR